MSLTNQQVFNHSQSFFLGRIQNNGGYTSHGWANPRNLDERCALGSMVSDYCENVFDVANNFAKLYGCKDYKDIYKEGSLTKEIMAFNDHHTWQSLSKIELDIKLSEWSKKFHLSYSSVLETPKETAVREIVESV